MEQFTINTSQNVSIVETYASIGERITATIIDYAIMGAYIVPVSILYTAAGEPALLIFLVLPLIFYHLIFELATNGQSPGKKAMKIKVVSEDGTAPSFTAIFIRWVFRLIDITISFGSVATIFIISSKKNQRIGDITGGTILIRTRKNTVKRSVFMEVPEGYSPVYPSVSVLNDNDIQVVREILGFLKSSRMNYESVQYATKAKKKLLLKMNTESDQSPDEFLETILRDYNYYNSK